MSQHDYVIENAGGATVRADINSVLAAIQSNNSGAVAPSATTAGMLWLDTPASGDYFLKVRDKGNNNWLTLGTVSDPGSDGNIGLPAGHVIQVVQGTSNTLDSTASGTFQDSGLSASLIPASADNKVLIMAMTSHKVAASDDYAGITIYRGTDATWNVTDLGPASSYGFANILVNGATSLFTNVVLNYLDSPSTDVSVKYTMAHRGWSGGTSIVQVNSVTATMILMEIQG